MGRGIGRLASGEACVRDIGELPKVQSCVRGGLVGRVGDHAGTVCGGGVGDENGVLFC